MLMVDSSTDIPGAIPQGPRGTGPGPLGGARDIARRAVPGGKGHSACSSTPAGRRGALATACPRSCPRRSIWPWPAFKDMGTAQAPGCHELPHRRRARCAASGQPPRGRYQLGCTVRFTHRRQEWLERIIVHRAVRYDIICDPVRGRWYLEASWSASTPCRVSRRSVPAGHPAFRDLRGEHHRHHPWIHPVTHPGMASSDQPVRELLPTRPPSLCPSRGSLRQQ